MSSIWNIILIRYNMAAPKRWLNGAPVHLDPDWLARREQLYLEYCLPSLRAQVAGSFIVLLFFDENTPDDIVARLGADDFIVPLFTSSRIDTGENMFEEITRLTNDFLREKYASASDENMVLATTRLDSDDALSPHYLESANRAFRESGADGEVYVYFPVGQQFILGSGEYLRYEYPKNAFGTLYEPFRPGGCRTVMHTQHTKMLDEHVSVVADATESRWCMIIHDNNISNKRRGRVSDMTFFKVGS